MATTAAVLRGLADAGASVAEIGVPYSDPVADGPVIQASYQRALDNGFRLSQLFDMGRQLTPTLAMPLITMTSYSIIHRVGGQRYVEQAQQAGFAGAIVPDLLVEEAAPLAKICRAADFSLIQLVTPTTPRERQLQIAEMSSGFIYFVSVTGITGERQTMPEGLLDSVAWLRQRTELPICIGFGVSSAETAKTLAPVADGVIVGSALVRRINQAATPEAAVASVSQFAKEIVAAISPAG